MVEPGCTSLPCHPEASQQMTDPTSDPISPVDLYLDLMKRCLTDLIYRHDPLANYGLYHPLKGRSPAKEWVLSAIDQFLRPHNIRVVEAQSTKGLNETLELRLSGADWPSRAHTMIGLKRLDNLQECIERIIEDKVPGDFIETGVWRGGACIFMRAMLKAYGDGSRLVWAADSFAGLPPPDSTNYPADKGDLHHTQDVLAVSLEAVQRNFEAYGLLDQQVRFLKGWFKDTLPDAPIKQLALMRLDGDMFESTWQALEALYPKLSPGGFVIIDDFMLPACARAVHAFRGSFGINDEIHDIDGFGAFWRRS